MVRSTGSPASSTAMPSLHTSPSAWCTAPERVGAQRHRAEDLAGPHVDLDAAPLRRRVEIELDRGAARPGQRAPRARPVPGGPGVAPPARAAPPAPRPSRRRAARAPRAARPPRPPRPRARAQRRAGAPRSGPRSAEPGVRPRRTHAGAVGAQADGERRALGPAAHHVLAAPQHPDGLARLVGQRPGARRHRAAPLAAEGAAVGERRGRDRRRAGTSWRRARRRRARPRWSAA